MDNLNKYKQTIKECILFVISFVNGVELLLY